MGSDDSGDEDDAAGIQAQVAQMLGPLQTKLKKAQKKIDKLEATVEELKKVGEESFRWAIMRTTHVIVASLATASAFSPVARLPQQQHYAVVHHPAIAASSPIQQHRARVSEPPSMVLAAPIASLAGRIMALPQRVLIGGVIALAAIVFGWIAKVLNTPSRVYDREANTVGREYDAWTSEGILEYYWGCLLYTSPSPRDS